LAASHSHTHTPGLFIDGLRIRPRARSHRCYCRRTATAFSPREDTRPQRDSHPFMYPRQAARCWLCSLAAWFRPSPTVKLPGPKKGNSCAPKPACTKTPAGRSVRRDHAHACQPGTRASVCVCRVGWASLNTLPQHGTKWRGTPGAAAPPMRQNTRPDEMSKNSRVE
jgi:hypothetical protein